MRLIGFLLLFAIPIVGGAAIYAARKPSDSVQCFQTEPVKRGDIAKKITATGTIEPEELVDVGAQVMGIITGFGKDLQGSPIDYNAVVDEGTELAYLDKTPYLASLEQAEASLDRAKADLLQYEAKLEQAEQDCKRAESLRLSNAISRSEYDAAIATYKAAKASVAQGKAAIRQSEASLKMAQTNLGYTTVKSPIRGVILARRVNIGQTVVASLNAPSLFLIAKDLRRMQVWASVSEADIGRISANMPVQFTVDAHPGETFHGKVTQIRMNAQMTQNVVTYTVVVTTDNPDGKLLPYLTASLQFEVERRSEVYLVPSSALSWSPQPSQISPKAKNDSAAIPKDSEHGCIWVDAGAGKVRPLAVKVGLDDLISTEVTGDGLEEGMSIVVGDNGAAFSSPQAPALGGSEDKASSPFMPKPPSGKNAGPPPPM